MTWDFFLTALIVVLLPGTGVIYTMAIAIGLGPRSVVIAALGCTLGIVPHMLATILGVAAVLHASAIAFQALKIVGIIFLLWMAWGVWHGSGGFSVEGNRKPAGWAHIVRDGILLNLLNPKLTIFFLAFLPQFVPMSIEDPTRHMFVLALVFMAMTFTVFVFYGAFAAWTRNFVIGRPVIMRWLRGSFALAFGLLGLKLAATSQ